MPLVIPSGESNLACICGIDPGTTTLGLSVMIYDVHDFSIKSVRADTFNAKRFINDEALISETHDTRTLRLIAQKNNLLTSIEHYKPNVICCENPFYNRLRPNAFGPLVETICFLRWAAMEYDVRIPFIRYEPAVVKKGVGAFATTDKKKDVFQAILAIPEIKDNFIGGSIYDLDEHSVDSIAVAYTHLRNIRKELSNV